MTAAASTPARATRSSVKAARARGDTEELLCGLPDTGRKPKTAPYPSVRIPFNDVGNISEDLETHAESPSKPAKGCESSSPPAKFPSKALSEEPCDVSASNFGTLGCGSDSAASCNTFCEADDASEEALEMTDQLTDQLSQQASSPDVRQAACTDSPIQALNSPSPGRWETDITSSPEAATLDTEETSTVVKSKVVVQDSFDPRSMRQLKKEYQQLKAAKAAAAAGLCLVDSGDDGGEEIEEYDDPSGNDTESEAEELTAALDGLCIRGPEVGSKVLLRGVPVAKGGHLRFEGDDKEGVATPGAKKVLLRGIPQAAGRHMRFD